jgi:SAM-dependent methyltransferase
LHLPHAQLLDGFVLDELTSVYFPSGRSSDFVYADGSEEKILEIVKSAVDVSDGSAELLRNINDFPSRYHLSPERSALLWPVRNLLRGRVLEIGAGCGALTRFLGEKGAEVLAVEGSPARAAICRERCRDLSNVSVLAANIADLPPSETFDAILLIGVLEYSRMYLGGPAGPAELLQKCRALLKPDGAVVVAIENQLGLKYFAGAPEDHLATPFIGLEDRYGSNTQVTFGRRELDELLASNGFLYREFLYPFPDYKFPRAILPDAALERDDINVGSVLKTLAAPNQFKPYWRTFSEEMSWPTVLRNGLARDLSNSFLLVASPVSDVQPQIERSICIFSTYRRPAFAKVTFFTPEEGSQVHRERLHPDAPVENGLFIQRLETEPLYRGKLLVEDFIRVLNRPGWIAEDLARCSEPWLTYLRQNAFSFADQANSQAWLPGEFLDCIPVNLARNENGVLFRFDREWIALQPISLAYVVFRGLLDPLTRLQSVAKPGHLDSMRTLALVSRTLQLLGLVANDAGTDAFLQQEIALQAYISGIPEESISSGYPDLTIPIIRAVDLLEESEALKAEAAAAERSRSEFEAAAERSRSEFEAKLVAQLRETERSRGETERSRGEADALRTELHDFRTEANGLQVEGERLRIANETLRTEVALLQVENNRLGDSAVHATNLERQLGHMQASAAWRLGLRLARLYHLLVPRRR